MSTDTAQAFTVQVQVPAGLGLTPTRRLVVTPAT
jgi:hypothetical protein